MGPGRVPLRRKGIQVLQEDLPECERRREGDPQLWMDPGCQGQDVLLNSSGRVQHRSLRLRRGRLQHCRHELHLCDCRPVHHGSWLPVTLDHPHLSNGGQSNLSRAETESSKHTKTFPRKTAVTTRQICSISDPAFSPELLSTQSLGFCSATRL